MIAGRTPRSDQYFAAREGTSCPRSSVPIKMSRSPTGPRDDPATRPRPGQYFAAPSAPHVRGLARVFWASS
jgi:hypothetical protein